MNLEKLLKESLLSEMGGNVFTTEKIEKAHVRPTFQKYQEEVLSSIPHQDARILGSGGKKAVSGDIDIGLETHLDLDRISDILDEVGIPYKRGGSNQIWTSFPQYNENGEKIGKDVQIDIMVGQLDWLDTAYWAPAEEESKYKGVHRNILLNAILKYVSQKEVSGGVERYAVDWAGGINKKLQFKKVIKKGPNKGKEKEDSKTVSKHEIARWDDVAQYLSDHTKERWTVEDFRKPFESLYKKAKDALKPQIFNKVKEEVKRGFENSQLDVPEELSEKFKRFFNVMVGEMLNEQIDIADVTINKSKSEDIIYNSINKIADELEIGSEFDMSVDEKKSSSNTLFIRIYPKEKVVYDRIKFLEALEDDLANKGVDVFYNTTGSGSGKGRIEIKADDKKINIVAKEVLKKQNRGNEDETMEFLNREKPILEIPDENGLKTEMKVVEAKKTGDSEGNAPAHTLADYEIEFENGETLEFSGKQKGSYYLMNHKHRRQIFDLVKKVSDDTTAKNYVKEIDKFYLDAIDENGELKKRTVMNEKIDLSDKVEFDLVFSASSERSRGEQRVDYILLSKKVIRSKDDILILHIDSNEFKDYVDNKVSVEKMLKTYDAKAKGKTWMKNYINKNNLDDLKEGIDHYISSFQDEYESGFPNIESFPFWFYNKGDNIQDYQLMGFDYHITEIKYSNK